MISSNQPFSESEFARILERILELMDQQGILWQELLLSVMVSLWVLGMLGMLASSSALNQESYSRKIIWMPFGVFLGGLLAAILAGLPSEPGFSQDLQIASYSGIALALGILRVRFGWLAGGRFLDLHRPRVFLVFPMIPVLGTILGRFSYYSVLRIRFPEQVMKET